jgi:hypothetical protein
MQSTAKSIALIRDLADLLSKRNMALNTVRQAFDANNWPYLVLSVGGNEAEGQPVLLIRISNVDMVSKDIFGNQTFAYAPHICEIVYELTSGGAPEVNHADLLSCSFEAIKTGVRVQLKEIANGTAVTAANIPAAAVADLDQLYWPTKLV